MATYKVIQDIEAEDHILGPLSFRQFVYALIAVFCLYLSFLFVTKHVPFLLVISLPPALFTGFLAFPFGKDQSTEIWALARLRFLLKPHKRIWDQSGVKELVTITAPKKIEEPRTNGLDQTEVKSRLQALADTIDTRGWAIKNVNVNLYQQPSLMSADGESDRLIGMSSMPQQVSDNDIQASDDMLDEQSNPVAQQMDQMINAASTAHRQQIMQELSGARQAQQAGGGAGVANDYWFLQQQPVPAPGQVAFGAPQPVPAVNGTPVEPEAGVAQPTVADEQALLEHIKSNTTSQHVSYGHLHTIQPLGNPPAGPVAAAPPQPMDDSSAPVPQAVTATTSGSFSAPTDNPAPVAATDTPSPTAGTDGQDKPSPKPEDAAILSLANNNDLNVATLAREAQKAKNANQLPQDEVVISLR